MLCNSWVWASERKRRDGEELRIFGSERLSWFFFSPQHVTLMCPARKTPELLCFYISDRVNHHLFYQKLLISLKYAILRGFGTFLSISTPSFSKYFFMNFQSFLYSLLLNMSFIVDTLILFTLSYLTIIIC